MFFLELGYEGEKKRIETDSIYTHAMHTENAFA